MIIDDAISDRLTSKRVTKQLELGHGVDGTRYIQNLWITRFDAYRVHTLHATLSEPFTPDDLMRFFDSMISKIKSRFRDKPAPNQSLFASALDILLQYGTFKWATFEMTWHHGTRMKTFFDDAVRAGRLTVGRWNKRVWLGFMLMARMGNDWLPHYDTHGALNWDVIISRLLSVVLVTSLGCRSGDVSRSEHWKGMEFIQYHDIILMLSEHGSKFEDLQAHIVIEFEKGRKDKKNDDAEVYLHPHEPQYSHSC